MNINRISHRNNRSSGAAAEQPAIVVKDLTKYYGRVTGIEHLNFAVNRGEIFGFLGPNGAGKTTTIRILLNLLYCTSGSAVVLGKHLPGAALEIRQRCGYLPGNFSTYQYMTAGDFLRFAARLRRVRTSIQSELVERFQLSGKDLAKKIKNLSHGTRQKIGIVQAFFHQPELLILDEPTIGLDPLMQEVLYDLLREFQQKGHTIFFSSHILSEVEKICQRVAIVRDGHLVALETLDDLKKKRYRRLQLFLKREIENLSLPSARLISHQGLQYEFVVKGELQGLLKALAQLPVENVVFPEPSLEEAFLAYYRSADNA